VIGYIDLRIIQVPDRGDHFHKKALIFAHSACLLTSGSSSKAPEIQGTAIRAVTFWLHSACFRGECDTYEVGKPMSDGALKAI